MIRDSPIGLWLMNQNHSLQPLPIRREDLRSSVASRLIEALNAELSAQYPEPGATHFRLDAEEVAADKGAFLVGYLDGEPVACGAIRCIDAGIAEIKRMYVIPAARGRGFSQFMLTALEDHARQLGIRRLVLETGPRQLAALALYRRAGFVAIARFGEYTHSELSLCMGKDLQEGAQISTGVEAQPGLCRD
jgi:putative acetyltransferase